MKKQKIKPLETNQEKTDSPKPTAEQNQQTKTACGIELDAGDEDSEELYDDF